MKSPSSPISFDDYAHWKPEIPHSFYQINPWNSIFMALTGLSLYILPLVAAYFILQLPLGFLSKSFVIILLGLLAAIGNVLLAIFTHEAAHYTLFKQRKLNQIAGILCLSITPSAFLSCTRFFELHVQHHKYFHSSKDPEDIFAPHQNKKLNMKILLLGMKNTLSSLIRYSISSIKNLFSSKQEPVIESEVTYVKHKKVLFVFEIIYYSLCLGVQIYVMWLFPPLILVYLVANLISLALIVTVGHASHEFGSAIHFQNEKLSKMVGQFFIKASFGTFLHFEHHIFPAVPAYQLPALSRYLFKQEFYKRNNIPLGSVHFQIVSGS